jgi:hypothetical protein
LLPEDRYADVGISVTKNATCSICCPNATGRGSFATIRGAWALTDAVDAEQQLERFAQSLSAAGRTPPRRCERGWQRRSR